MLLKKIKNGKWMYKLGSMVAAFALMVTALNVNTTCVYIAHQAKLPDSAEKLRKF